MELKTLLQNSGWEDAVTEPSGIVLPAGTEGAIGKNIRVLVLNNYKALLLNAGFLCIAIYVYLQNPTVAFLIPSLLISSCFLFLIISVWGGIKASNRIDHAQSTAIVLSEVLATNQQMYQNQCRYHSVLLTQSFLGGFLLGLAFQGWTIQKTMQEPSIFVIIIPMTIGFYYLTKTKSFRSINQLLNPSYFKAKNYLEEQLSLLQE